jgi:hypothetical protein
MSKRNRLQLFLGTTATGTFQDLSATVDYAYTLEADLETFASLELYATVDYRYTLEGQLDPDSFPPRSMPCPGLPVRRLRINPVRATDPRKGPLWQEPAERISRLEVQVRLEALAPTEREQLVALWEDGRAQIWPFEFTVPGEADPGLFVFKEPLRVTRQNPATAAASVTLLEVTPAGWNPDAPPLPSPPGAFDSSFDQLAFD